MAWRTPTQSSEEDPGFNVGDSPFDRIGEVGSVGDTTGPATDDEGEAPPGTITAGGNSPLGVQLQVQAGSPFSKGGHGVLGYPSTHPLTDLTQVPVQLEDGTTVTRYQRPSGDNAWMVGDAEPRLRRMHPLDLKRLQGLLAGAGLLSEAAYGQPLDERTRNAVEKAMAMANLSDIPLTALLGRMASSQRDQEMAAAIARQQELAAASTRAPFVAQVSNAEDLRQFFQQQLVEMTGSGSTNVDIDQMVSNYQAEQRNSQAAAYNAAPRGGTVEGPMSPEAYAEQQLNEVAGTEVQANSVVDRAGDLLGMLGSFGGV